MLNPTVAERPTYEQFRDEWIADVEADNPSNLVKGQRFATKLVEQWLGVTSDDDDFVILDGSGEGGIDVAYLQRADLDADPKDTNSVIGDTWYLVQGSTARRFPDRLPYSKRGKRSLRHFPGETSGCRVKPSNLSKS